MSFSDTRSAAFQPFAEASEFSPWVDDSHEFTYKSYCLAEQYPEVSSREFYRDMFPLGSLRTKDPTTKGKGNAVIVVRNELGKHLQYVVFDDLEFIEKFKDAQFAIVAPCSFFGRKPDGAHVHEVFGFAIDVDLVHPSNLRALFYQIDNNIIPEPTYVVNSGHGVHVYYLLDEPIPTFSNIKRKINDFKDALTLRVSNQYTSSLSKETSKKTPDLLWFGQGMRVVGGQTKFGDLGPDYRIKAFKTGGKVSLNYLNQFVPEEVRLEDLIYEPEQTVPLDEARLLWPDWYARKIQKRKAPRWQWNVDRAVYEWWKEKITDGAVVGTRYFCTMCLAIYARKCNVPYDELYADALRFQKVFNGMDPDNPFTVDDVEVALRGYRPRYNTFPIKDIQKLTKIEIEKNVRNGRDRWTHLQSEFIYVDGKKRRNPCLDNRLLNAGRLKGSGTKRDLIQSYARDHPDANHSEIARALGVSRPTVIKWLRSDSQSDSQE